MAHNLQSFGNIRFNANTNRATIDSNSRPNNNFVQNIIISSKPNPRPPLNNQLNQLSAPHPTPTPNMVANSYNRPKSQCSCDPEFIEFCKIHTISHTDCGTTRQVVCQLCSTSADPKSIQWHLQTDKHKRNHTQLMDYVLLLSLPEYSPSQAKTITDVLLKTYSRVALNKSDIDCRLEVFQQLNNLIKSKGLDGYSLRIYGSTLSGFALKESDINLDIVCDLPESGEKAVESVAIILSKISEIVDKERNEFHSLRKDFNLKVPKLRFKDKSFNLEIEVTITSEKSFRLSKLLQQYSQIDERVKVLGIVFREWARIYGFDDQENGLWPSFAFPILAIHYLQRCSPPVIPCLHELFSNMANTTPTAPTTPASITPTAANAKETPNHPTRGGYEDNDAVEDLFNLSSLNWQKINTKSVGELWLDMLRYYAVQFDTESYVVSIRTLKPLQTRADKHWSTRMMAVEDPARPSLNLSRSVGSMRLYNIFVDQLQQTFKYFAIPFINVTSNNRNDSYIKPLFTERDLMVVVNQNHRYDNIDVNDLLTEINHIRRESESENKNQKPNHRGSDDSDSDDENRKKENFHLKANRLLKTFGIWMQLLPEVEGTVKLIPANQLSYTFALNRLPFFQRPPKFCRLCHRYSHQQNRCPEQELPPLRPIPEYLDPIYDEHLNRICIQIFDEKRMDRNDQRIQNDILLDLEQFIQKEIPNARLSLFGSTKNGFGARNCDLDICLTFENNPNGEGLEYDKIIENLGQLMKSHPKLVNILPIVTAKVPIIKFGYIHERNHCVECDISLYNILAIHNTEMLSAYTQIDPRVAILGFVVKHFAKTCDMCDASRGSLSSYAYTLMTIHYLQQKRIIPVLQEVGLEHKKERVVDGWDTWYFDDLDSLPNYWKRPQNNESVAQLFVNFLRYYSQIFNFDEYVICCRQFSLLKRLEKMWTGSKIAIEDPFLLSHNLGAGVSAQMAVFIRTAFVKGRNLFGSIPSNNAFDQHRYRTWTEYFFNRHQLTNGLPPTGRGCRICGKIGHKKNICPERRRDNRDSHRDRETRFERNDRNPKINERTERMDRSERPLPVHRTESQPQQRPQKHERPERYEKSEDRPQNRDRNEKQNRPEMRHEMSHENRPEKPKEKRQNSRRKRF